MNIKAVQKFFFKAMLAGWAGNCEKQTITGMPGYKSISFRDGDFLLVDIYCVTPNSRMSVGTTTIFVNDIPVWIMQYGGYYHDEAIPFLKRCLVKAYEGNLWCGGRGPVICREGSLVYANRPHCNTFDRFQGREEVYDGTKLLGYHEYKGFSLEIEV